MQALHAAKADGRRACGAGYSAARCVACPSWREASKAGLRPTKYSRSCQVRWQAAARQACEVASKRSAQGSVLFLLAERMKASPGEHSQSSALSASLGRVCLGAGRSWEAAP